MDMPDGKQSFKSKETSVRVSYLSLEAFQAVEDAVKCFLALICAAWPGASFVQSGHDRLHLVDYILPFPGCTS